MFESSSIDQRQLDEIKARYGIGGRASGPSRFPIVLIKPSRYDIEGYVIQWYRGGAAAEAQVEIRELIQDCKERKVLGEQVQVEIQSIDENNTRIRTQKLARRLKNGQGLVMLVGVESNQFSRAMDIALPLRVAGVQVCMGGLHVSETLARGGVTAGLQEAMNLGISLFAGDTTEDRLVEVLRDAWRGEMKPLYQQPNDPASPVAIDPAGAQVGRRVRFDAEPGSAFPCAFGTMIHVEAREPGQRTVDEVERIVRGNLKQGAGRFQLLDDNFSGNPEWEAIFERLIEMRERDKLNIQLMVRVDATCHRVPGFIEKAGRAGVRRVLIGLDSNNSESLQGVVKQHKAVSEYRKMLLQWKRTGAIVSAEYIVPMPGETRESVQQDIRIIQQDLAIDLLEPKCLSELPLADGNFEGATTGCPAMTTEQSAQLSQEAWKEFYKLEHMEKVLRRAAVTGTPLESMMSLLVWFHFCILYEKIDPAQGGYLRRKYRTDRRPTLPREGWLRFWTRYGTDLVYKHWKMLRLYVRFRHFVAQLERAGDARNYTDAALTADSGAEGNGPGAPRPLIAVAR